jgi:hypothetical protein
MARAYTIATAALAVGTSSKWLDNTLSHYRVSGVVQRKQGVARRITIEGLLTLSVALTLISELGATVASAVNVADKVVAAGGMYASPDGVRIEVDLQHFRNRLLERLEHAVEVAPVPKRGRPPKTTTGRLE